MPPLRGVRVHSPIGVVLAVLFSVTAAGAVPQTQELKGVVANQKGLTIAEAVCTLQGVGLPSQGVVVTTDERGRFDFPGLEPGQYNLSCAAVGYLPISENGLQITRENPQVLNVVLPAAEKLHQTVEVHESASPLSTENTETARHVSAPQLSSLPLVQEQFLAALPLVPGVVRTPDGKINIKGSAESQSMLLVDNTEMVDPITGSYSIDLPIDAIESVNVSKAPYNAEYGHFSGGLTSVITKPPSNKWDFQLFDLVPSFRVEAGHISGVDGNSPRVRFSVPLDGSRLTMSESFAYFMHKDLVRGLPWPNNQTIRQGFNSFTNLQYVVSAEHFLTFNLHFFPARQEFADINSLVPQTASSNYGQRGFSVGMKDRRVFASGGLLSTTLQYTNFSSYAHGQGIAQMLVTPNGWGGNFFNAYNRTSHQGEVRESYQYPLRHWHGKHELKIGGDAIFRTFTGTSRSMPVSVQRADGTLAEQIAFTGQGLLNAHDTEGGIFAQDHWEIGESFALDAGARLSGQTLGKAVLVAPRLGFEFAPGKAKQMIFRGGVGVFHSGVPLLAGSFTGNPTRAVTMFDSAGAPLGPPESYPNVYAFATKGGYRVLPSGQDLDSTPYNVTWNTEFDRDLGSRVTLRLSYLSSRTYDLFLVGPGQLPGTGPLLLMTNNGGARYHESETTVRYHTSKFADINFSFVNSNSRGDLNNLAQMFVPFEEPVIRPNYFSVLNSDVPNRFVTWGRVSLPWKITASPVLDIHSGYPYSAIDALQNYVGAPNSLRMPTFASIDLKLAKDFRISFIPWVRNHQIRGAISVYNLTNHLNPRDVYNNITSPYFGHLAGPQHRFLEPFVDFVY